MRIPQGFKDVIKNTFYDKVLTLYTTSTEVSDTGWVRQKANSGTTFSGNIQFDKLDRVREEYGLDQSVSATLTTDQVLGEDQIIGYAGKAYKVIRSLKRDSHYFAVLKEWSLKSSTWTD